VKYLLDANAVIAIFKGDARFIARLKRHAPADFAIPAIVAHELFYGAYRSQRVAENLARVEAMQFEVLEFDREDARLAGQARAAMSVAGTPIGPYDVLIAGQALARDLTLVTHNAREFERIAGLKVEDWER
jgi:tRNA(fMet)-specific endonuclease VapC